MLLVSGGAGCSVGPDYRAPELQVGERFTNAPDTRASREVDLLWWRSFKDPLLNNLIDDAIRENRDIDLAVARLNESRSISQQAFQDLLPGTVADLGYRSELLSETQIPNSSYSERRNDSYRTGLDVSWELDFVGGLRRKLESAEAREEATAETLNDVVRIVLADVATNYLQLRGLQHQLDVARRNYENQAGTMQVVQTRVQAGEASELDETRTKAQHLNTLSTIPPLEEAIQVTIHRLSVLTGRQPTQLKPLLSAQQPLPPYEGPGTVGDPGGMLRRRPDVRMAERMLAAATSDIGVAVANFYPKVTFSGSVALQATSLTGLVEGSEIYSVGPRLSWVGLNVNRIRSQIRGAKARSEGAVANYNRVVLTALEETENSFVRLSSERARRDSLLEAAAQSRRAAELAREQFRIGATDLLTVLDTERVALIAESELSRSETRLRVNLIGVYKALGGGWEAAKREERIGE